MRFGSNKGSLVLTRTGQYRGHWRDFSNGEHGTLLTLIAKHEGLRIKEDFKLVLEKAVDILGRSHESMMTLGASRQAPARPHLAQKIDDQTATIEAKQTAQSIWSSTQPLNGSLAEHYLKAHRGIDRTDTLAVRFLAAKQSWQLHQDGKVTERVVKTPALVIGAKDANEELTGVQLIYLDRKTGNKNRWMDDPKISRGRIKGAAGVIQQGEKGGRVILAEGPETAASLARTDHKATVLSTFSAGNLAHLTDRLKALTPREVVIAADHDGGNRAVQMSLAKALLAYHQSGLSTQITYPKLLKGHTKTD